MLLSGRTAVSGTLETQLSDGRLEIAYHEVAMLGCNRTHAHELPFIGTYSGNLLNAVNSCSTLKPDKWV